MENGEGQDDIGDPNDAENEADEEEEALELREKLCNENFMPVFIERIFYRQAYVCFFEFKWWFDEGLQDLNVQFGSQFQA